MVGFYNKPLSFDVVIKAIAEHHFRMPDEHLQELMKAIENERRNSINSSSEIV